MGLLALVMERFQADACAMTFVGDFHQFDLASIGLNRNIRDRSESVCALVVDQRKPVVITDLSSDSRTSHIDLEGLITYAGVPLRSADGHIVGAICIYYDQAQAITGEELETLGRYGRMAESELTASSLGHIAKALLDYAKVASEQALVDPLTGLWNRRAILQQYTSEFERAHRQSGSLAVVMIDIDHFKQINDRYGHPVGDEVLKKVTGRLGRSLRSYDQLGRYGGEEFFLILHGVDAQQAQDICERLAHIVRFAPIPVDSQKLSVTCSFGVAMMRAGDTEASLLARADAYLYRAKKTGRDRVASLEDCQIHESATRELEPLPMAQGF